MFWKRRLHNRLPVFSFLAAAIIQYRLVERRYVRFMISNFHIVKDCKPQSGRLVAYKNSLCSTNFEVHIDFYCLTRRGSLLVSKIFLNITDFKLARLFLLNVP
jgi:hypothetical protein